MNPEQVQEHDDLTLAVRDLISEVRGLNDKLKLYAPREEVRRDGRRRAWSFLGFALVIILVAQSMTMSTISYCFLDATGTRHTACNALPGYGEAMEQGDLRLKRFELLLTTIESNERRIAELERQVDQLQKEG